MEIRFAALGVSKQQLRHADTVPKSPPVVMLLVRWRPRSKSLFARLPLRPNHSAEELGPRRRQPRGSPRMLQHDERFKAAHMFLRMERSTSEGIVS